MERRIDKSSKSKSKKNKDVNGNLSKQQITTPLTSDDLSVVSKKKQSAQRGRAFSDDSIEIKQHRSFRRVNSPPKRPRRKPIRITRVSQRNMSRHDLDDNRSTRRMTRRNRVTTDDDGSLGSVEGALCEDSITVAAAESSWGMLGDSGDSSTFPTVSIALSNASKSALNASLGHLAYPCHL